MKNEDYVNGYTYLLNFELEKKEIFLVNQYVLFIVLFYVLFRYVVLLWFCKSSGCKNDDKSYIFWSLHEWFKEVINEFNKQESWNQLMFVKFGRNNVCRMHGVKKAVMLM